MGACPSKLFQRCPAVVPAGNLGYKWSAMVTESLPTEKARALQEAMKIVLEACPELLRSIDKEAVEDASVVRYVLEYACSLSKARFDSEAQFITLIVAKTAGVQPRLAESIVSAVEERAVTDTGLAADLRELFNPVVESMPKRVPTWQAGLREVLGAGSFYIFDINAFEDKVRGTSGRRNLTKFRVGLNAFLLMKEVPDGKKEIILKRVGLLLAPLAAALASPDAFAGDLLPSRTDANPGASSAGGGSRMTGYLSFVPPNAALPGTWKLSLYEIPVKVDAAGAVVAKTRFDFAYLRKKFQDTFSQELLGERKLVDTKEIP